MTSKPYKENYEEYVIAVSAYALSPKPRTVDVTQAARHSVLKLSLCQTERGMSCQESGHSSNTSSLHSTSPLSPDQVRVVIAITQQSLSRSSQSYLRQNTKWHVIRFCKQKLDYDLSIGGKHHFPTITSSKVNGIRKLLSCRNDLFIAEKC